VCSVCVLRELAGMRPPVLILVFAWETLPSMHTYTYMYMYVYIYISHRRGSTTASRWNHIAVVAQDTAFAHFRSANSV
jgi:hypothetical protein